MSTGAPLSAEELASLGLTASDVEIHAREILYLRGRLNEILAKHTGQSVETIAKDTDRDNFLSGEDAVKYGIVDKVLTSREPG